VVRRGILGFDYPSLVNVIDISCSQNVDNILQLLCRVVRVSNSVEQKLFYKVCPLELVEHFKYVMTAVMCLTRQDYYLKFNGKNFLELPIIACVNRLSKNIHIDAKQNRIQNIKSSKFRPLEFSGMPVFNFFSDCLNKMGHQVLCSYAYTTLREVIKTNNRWNGLSKQEILERCKISFIENGCKSIADYKRLDSTGHSYLNNNGLKMDFCRFLGIAKENIYLQNIPQESKFDILIDKYRKHNCRTMDELRKIDSQGYFFLYSKNLINQFCEKYNIKQYKSQIQWNQLKKEERFELFYSTFQKNNCKSLNDYLKVDPNGHRYLSRKQWIDEFCEKYNIRRRLKRRLNVLTKYELFDFLYKEYTENECATMEEFFKVDSTGYNILSRNRWINEFRVKYKISR
jgi:hypothetical protein